MSHRLYQAQPQVNNHSNSPSRLKTDTSQMYNGQIALSDSKRDRSLHSASSGQHQIERVVRSLS